jgi:hypothetical protein
MTRANPILSNFNAGELSPLIGGRPELAKFQTGLSVCKNFIPRVQGALTRRGGTRYVVEARDTATPNHHPWFVRFVFAVNDAFVLEFGDTYIRFYRDRGVLTLDPDALPAAWSGATAYVQGDLVSRAGVNYYCEVAHTNHGPPNSGYWHPLPGTVYEIPAPYVGSALASAKDGSFAIRYTQSGDVIYLAHPAYQPRKLTRRGNTDWVLEPYEPDGGPFKDQNEDETITVYATAVNVGDETSLVAEGGDIFLPGHVGALFYLQMKDGGDIKPWEVYQRVVVDEVRRSDGKYYKCTQVGAIADQYTGTDKPIHTSGRYWDGDGLDKDTDDKMGSLGAEWEYMHPGYGWVKITGYTDARHVTAHVVSRLPEQLVTAGLLTSKTWRWAMGAWSEPDGYPNTVAFFRERLAWAKDQSVEFSQAGDYANFKAKDFGEQLASSAFRVLVQSGTGDAIEWLAPTQRLLVGTGGSVHAIGESSTAQAFGPANARQEDQVMPGVSGAPPVFAGSVLYAEKSGRIVNEAAYSAEVGKYAASDLTIFAEHISLSGLTSMAFQKQPHAIVWCARTDGGLVGLTFNKDQQVVGWHRQEIGGPDAFVEHVCVIPSPETHDIDGGVTAQAGARDDVWLIVRRTIGGQVRRYVEFVTPEYQEGDDQALSGYADCHLVHDGEDPVTELIGLDHLEGCVVQVKANGAAHRDLRVEDGAVTLDAPATRAVVGLPARALAMLMPLEAGAEIGTAQAQLKRIHKATLRLVDSLGGAVGPDFTTLQPLEYRWPHDRMDQPPPLLTGDIAASFPGDYGGRATVAIDCDQGFPFTLTAILPELATYDV